MNEYLQENGSVLPRISFDFRKRNESIVFTCKTISTRGNTNTLRIVMLIIHHVLHKQILTEAICNILNKTCFY